ncbi:MAG: hypothetical protein ACD_13C00053G0002 [uncultured bacterium]|nr:MAG: hypothetical protein ACD_13C00053G0002 [uncultured bacterium]
MSSQNPRRLVKKSIRRGYFFIAASNVREETFRVDSSISIGIGVNPS